MNFKKIFSDSNSKASFFAGVIVAFAVFLLINTRTGISDEKLRDRDGKPDYNRGDTDVGYPKGDIQNLQLVVKYISGGDIVILGEKGEVIARSSNEQIKQGPLIESRNIKFVTVTENSYETDIKGQKTGLIDSIIPAAFAATTVRYEYHYIWIDHQMIACRKHKVTTNPTSHTDIGKCPNS